jgi:hypothetical protein
LGQLLKNGILSFIPHLHLELNEITGTIDKHKDKCKYHILPIRRDITNFNAHVQNVKMEKADNSLCKMK